MSRTITRVVNDILLLDKGEKTLIVGQDPWFEWLDSVSSFSYEAALGGFNAHKERRKSGGEYWKAYRKKDGVLCSVYLGKSRELESAKLAEAAWRLASRAPKVETLEPWDGPPKTKFFPPPPDRRRIPRPRLFGRLSSEPDSIIFVSAPAGCGKTTAIADWIQTEGSPVAWLSLDERDDECVRFWTVLSLAIESAWPGRGSLALSLLLESGLSPEEILSPLVNELTAKVGRDGTKGGPSILVLDDYQTIRNEAVHRSLCKFLELAPRLLRVAILSRDAPPAAFARLRAGGRALELGAGELSFRRDETASLMALAAGANLEENILDRIEEKAEGWASFLMLAAKSFVNAAGPEALPRGDEEPLYSFFAEELLSRLDEDSRSFLLCSSVLDRLCPELCDFVLGFPKGEGRGVGLIARIDATRFFLVPLEAGDGWYRHRRLFAEALLSRLRAERPGEEPELRKRAALWLGDHGLYREEWAQWIALRDYVAAARAIDRMSVACCERGEFTALGKLITSMPGEIIEASPSLSIVLAMIKLLHGDEEGLESLLEGIESSIEDGAAEEVEPELSLQAIAAWISAIRAISVHSIRENLPAARHRAKAALADLESSGGRLFPLAKLVYGSVLIFCDAVVEAEHAYAEAAAEAAEGSYARYAALLHRGCMVFERGRLDEAKNLAEAALRAMSCGSAKGMATRGMGDIVVGLIAYERDDLDEAERAVLRALGCIRGASGSRQRERASICLARIRMARGDRDGAIAIIESVLSELGSGYRLSQPSLDAWRLRFKLSHAGRRTHVSAREETLAWLAKVERELDPADLPIVHYSSRELLPMMARAYLFLGDSGEALRVLGTALPRAVEAEAVDLEIELRSIEALALDAAGRIEESIASIQTALELGCHEGYIRSFADEGQPMAKLLKRARTRMSPQYRPYIATILASVAHLSAEGDVPSIATACEPAVPAISPSEEAVLSLAAQGLSNAAIAQALFIAESTVKAHLGSTYKKLGADNRAGAIVTARRLGILR